MKSIESAESATFALCKHVSSFYLTSLRPPPPPRLLTPTRPIMEFWLTRSVESAVSKLTSARPNKDEMLYKAWSG